MTDNIQRIIELIEKRNDFERQKWEFHAKAHIAEGAIRREYEALTPEEKQAFQIAFDEWEVKRVKDSADG